MAEASVKYSTESEHKGSFLLKKTEYTVTMTTLLLNWIQTNGKNKDEVSVPIGDVLSVKASSSKSKGGIDTFVFCYVMRKKNNILRKTSVSFTGSSEQCIEWAKHLQQNIDGVKQRPRKMLVFINPVSGQGKARKEYMGTVAPIFHEANIHTDVVETERAHFTEEVLSKYDLTTTDSIVVVGGDGIYHEVANGMLRRMTTDANINVNNPDNELPNIDIPIGIIPCGTGNGIAAKCHGNKDIETSALSIVIGKTNGANVYGVYSGGELLVYSVLMVGYGFWGDIAYTTESRRASQGTFRHPITFVEFMIFKTQRPIDLSIQYIPVTKSANECNLAISTAPASSLETNNDTTTVVKTEKTSFSDISLAKEERVEHLEHGSDWITLDGIYGGIISFIYDLYSNYPDTDRNTDRKTTLRYPSFMTNTACGRLKFMSFFYKLLVLDPEILQHEALANYVQFKELRLKLKNACSNPGSELDTKEHVLNIDGEVFMLKHPEYHLKFYPRKLKLFSNVPED